MLTAREKEMLTRPEAASIKDKKLHLNECVALRTFTVAFIDLLVISPSLDFKQ